MLTADEFEAHCRRIEERRAVMRASTGGGGTSVWPTPDDAGTGVVPISVAPGRGDLQYSSMHIPTVPTAMALINKTVSFARLFQTQPWVASAIMWILTRAIRVPLRAYRKSSTPNAADLLTADQHPLANMIENPWPGGNPAQLIMNLLGPLLVHGNSVGDVDTSHVSDGAIGYKPKDWRYCQPIMPDRMELDGFRFDWDIPRKQYDRSITDVLHVAYYSPTGPIGTSPLMQLNITLSIEDAAQRYQVNIFRNGARPPSAIISSEAFLGIDPAERQKIMAQLRLDLTDIYAGPENAGKPALLPPGLDWKEVGQSVIEAALVDQRKLTREEVAAVYLIPPPLLGILDRATYSNIGIQRDMCVAGDALVATDHGPVEASNVQAGDRVWAVKDGKLQSSVVSWQGQTGVRPLVTIATLDRTLRVTDNHPVLVARRKRNNKPWHEWVPAGQIEPGDLIVEAEKLPDYGVRSCPTRDGVTVGFAEFCGLWLGDGSVVKDKAGVPRRVMITRADTARYMDHYRQVMRQEFGQMTNGGDRWRHDVATASVTPVKLREHDRQTEFCSTAAAQEIVELGFGTSAHTKQIPEWVFRLDPELRAAFLRGFFDADGSVDKKGHVIVALCNERLVRQLRELCISIGVPVSNVRVKRCWSTLPGGHKVFSAMWRFVAGNPQANAEIVGSHDPQDLKRMQAGRPWRRRYENDKRSSPLPTIDGCIHAKVLTVERGQVSVPVYNITVPDGQNFVVDGVVTHNTYTEVIGPPLILIEQAINAQIARDLLQDDQVYVQFDFGAVLRGDRLQEIQMLRDAVGSALLTPNEARAVIDKPSSDDKGMDKFWLPTINQLQPVDIASEPPPPGADPGAAAAPGGTGEAQPEPETVPTERG